MVSRIFLHFVFFFSGNRLVKAASEVAKTIGGDTEKTEMELLNLYLKKEPTDESAGSEQKIVSLKYVFIIVRVNVVMKI